MIDEASKDELEIRLESKSGSEELSRDLSSNSQLKIAKVFSTMMIVKYFFGVRQARSFHHFDFQSGDRGPKC